MSYLSSRLTRDASAPQCLNNQQKMELEMDAELVKLKSKCKCLCRKVIATYHQLHKGRGTELYNDYRKAQNDVRAKRKKLHKSAMDRQHKDFFANFGNQIIEQNYHGESIKFQPDLSHVVPLRTQLVEPEFKNRDVDAVDDAELLEDRIQSLELRLELHNLKIPKALHRRIKFNDPGDEPPAEVSMPMKSKTGLECPVCLGRSKDHPRARRCQYSRNYALQDHFKTHKLSKAFPQGRQYDYPGCEVILYTLPSYKLHQADGHGISL